jgi:CRISPR-associated endonuclease Cas1
MTLKSPRDARTSGGTAHGKELRMPTQRTATNRRRREQERDHRQPPAQLRKRGAVCVVDGYGSRVAVEKGQLLISDGSGRQRRERRYARTDLKLSRVVVLGSAGSLSLAAIRWLADLGVPLIHIDRDGRLLATATPEAAHAQLRRAQALALFNSSGLAVARYLLSEKLAGQERLLARLQAVPNLQDEFARAVERLEQASDLNALLLAERDAALTYWSSWASVELRFRSRDQAHLPEHWPHFGKRGSPLTAAPRAAVNPANAMLNYLYAIVEAEARIALLTVGLDPGLGIVHADVRARDSLALDLIEAVRPNVDAYLLQLISSRAFRANDFYETRKGVCRLLAPLTHELAETAPVWGELLAPVAEQVAAMLADAPGARIDRLATPLTNANRHAGRDGMRRRTQRKRRPSQAKPARRCQRCGGELPHQGRVYCDACLPLFQREQLERAGVAPSPVDVLRRSRGGDPTHGAQAAARRGASTAKRKRELAQWEQQHGKLVDLSAFEREILPLIREAPLSQLVSATGLSLRYCSQIRRGERVPHPRHWEAFREAAP